MKQMKKGMIIMEIILSLAIFSVICFPLLLFVFSAESSERRAVIKDKRKYQSLTESNLRWVHPNVIGSQTNKHSCDLAFLQANFSSDLSAMVNPTISPTINYPQFFAHERNIISVSQYIEYEGREYVFLGTNSASTSDPDLYMYSRSDSGSFILEKSLQTGPGIVDLEISEGSIFAIERSVVQPLWKARLRDLLADIGSEPTNAITATSTATTSSTTSTNAIVTPISMPLQNVYPHSLVVANGHIYVGLEKNTQQELLLFNALSTGHEDTTYVLVSTVEIGAGINDMEMTEGMLYVASPANSELKIFELENNILNLIGEFDAPGSSGNGKSLAMFKNDIYMGRTVGNEELYLLQKGIAVDAVTNIGTTTGTNTGMNVDLDRGIDINILASMDINKSVLQIEEVLGGQYVFVLTKSAEHALLIFKKKDSRGLETVADLALSAIPTSMTCSKEELLISTESTTTPMVVITF